MKAANGRQENGTSGSDVDGLGRRSFFLLVEATILRVIEELSEQVVSKPSCLKHRRGAKFQIQREILADDWKSQISSPRPSVSAGRWCYLVCTMDHCFLKFEATLGSSAGARYPKMKLSSAQSERQILGKPEAKFDYHNFLKGYISESSHQMVSKEELLDGRVSSKMKLLQTSPAICPLDFTNLKEYPWFVETCQQMPQNYSTCCTALYSALALAEAEYLRTDGLFRLEDTATVGACVGDLNSQLKLNGLQDNSVMDVCFPVSNYSRFVRSPTKCAGIETRSDFYNLIGPLGNESLANSCSGDLINIDRCAKCVDAMTTVTIDLTKLGGPNNSVDCLYYTLFYAAGISNEFGPWRQGSAECIMAVKIAHKGSSNKLGLFLGVGSAVAVLACLMICGSFCFYWKRRKIIERRAMMERNKMIKSSVKPNVGLLIYKYDEVKAATKNFSQKNFIGSGGFGDVFKGQLKDGTKIAVKRMKNCTIEGDTEFVNEVEVMNNVRHRNLVMLRGCCVSGKTADGPQRLLIYDYLPNGSLHDYLSNVEKFLTWPERKKLAVGVAKGISYLHNGINPPIIHRDIKPSNILLDENMDAQVADFGLARFKVEGLSHITTIVAGTRGYLAPEYALYGQLTVRSDVYSFGVLLLELMSGRPALCDDKQGLQQITDWAWAMVKTGNVVDIVDERIRDVGPQDVMARFILVGILCSHLLVACRPTMPEVLDYLEGNLPVPDIPDRPVPVTSPAALLEKLDSFKLFPNLKNSSSSFTGEFSGRSASVSLNSLLR
ncbi:hypothetical protein R1flu_005042 [Riccia fluitans]|uniref:non-specific serine/threonine protein kinase n=1 Tax=Riccia fluitans TaxID=41844 RepID=A0ABD1YSM3_9MARC